MGEYMTSALLVGENDDRYLKLFAQPPLEKWEVLVWGTPGLSDETGLIKIWCLQLGDKPNTGSLMSDVPWMLLGPNGDVLWTGVIDRTGNAANPIVTIDIPIVKTAEPGRETAAVYTLTQVPEPGSIVALCSGLIGLAGFGIRRRK